jgi:hypothetical protein
MPEFEFLSHQTLRDNPLTTMKYGRMGIGIIIINLIKFSLVLVLV